MIKRKCCKNHNVVNFFELNDSENIHVAYKNDAEYKCHRCKIGHYINKCKYST